MLTVSIVENRLNLNKMTRLEYTYEEVLVEGRKMLNDTRILRNYAVMFDIDLTFQIGDYYVAPIVTLMHLCREAGVKIIIITARKEQDGRHKSDELYLTFDGIPFDELHYRRYSPKDDCKKETGYKYLFSVGDVWGDVDGEHGGKGLKLKSVLLQNEPWKTYAIKYLSRWDEK